MRLAGIKFCLFCVIFLFQLKEYRSLYEGYIPMKYKHYYKKMEKYVGLFSVSTYIFLDSITLYFQVQGILLHSG